MNNTSLEESLKIVNDLLDLEFVRTHKGDELKGDSVYLNAEECKQLSKVFLNLALELAITER